MTARTSGEPDWRRFLSVGLRMALIVLLALLARFPVSLLWVHAPFWIPPVVHDTATALVKWTGVALAVVYGVERTR